MTTSVQNVALAAVVALACIAPPRAAQAERVCVEEVSGVCLKYQDAAPKPAPAPAPAPAAPKPAPVVSPAERGELALGLSRNDRRALQRGLAAEGFYNSAIDGIFGGGTRGAIASWQRANGLAATGFLDRDAVSRLYRAAAQAAPASAPTQTGSTRPSGAASADAGGPTIPFGDIVNNLSCQTVIDSFFTSVTFRSNGSMRAIAEDAAFRPTWVYKNNRFCILNQGREIKCIDIDVPPTSANADRIRTLIRSSC